MNERIRHLLNRITALECELAAELHHQRERLHSRMVDSRIEFSAAIHAAHCKLRTHIGPWLLQSRPQSVLSLAFIYAMLLPLLLLDLSITLYQAICFPLYGIGKVRHRDYIAIDRHRLGYLNAIEKVHCVYCSYANGLLAFAREISARTEQYWCPIKHSRPLRGTHARYVWFMDYGDPTDFIAHSERLRKELTEVKVSVGAAPNNPVATRRHEP